MDKDIVAPNGAERKIDLAYFRINPITLYLSNDTVFVADGVISVDGCGWLGQVRGTGPAFVVAPYVDSDGYGWMAPGTWTAAITAVSRENDTLTIPAPSDWQEDPAAYAA